jgi:hypothetical protein
MALFINFFPGYIYIGEGRRKKKEKKMKIVKEFVST